MNNDTTENIPNELPDPTRLSRNGKIARLPKHIRQQLNLRLQEHQPTKDLVEWLNSLPEVKTVLAAEFDGRPIRIQNIYEWRNGGYGDWCTQQEALAMMERLTTDTEELQQQGPVMDKLAVWLATRYVVAARSITDEQGGMDWQRLRELTRDVIALRRSEVWSQRMQLEREKFAYQQVQDERDLEREFWQRVAQPEICEKITKRYEGQADKVAWAGYQMFGEFWDGPMPPGAPPLTEAQLAKVVQSAKARAEYTAAAAAKAAEELKVVMEQVALEEAAKNQEAEKTSNNEPPEETPNTKIQTPKNPQPSNAELGTGNSELGTGNSELPKTGSFRVIRSDSESQGNPAKGKQPKRGQTGQSNGSTDQKGG